MDYELAGKCAVVTGASRGLGAAIAEALAREGMQLLLIARDRAKLDQVAARLTDRHGVTVDVHAADLSSAEALANAAQAALASLPSIDVLINCAGATKRGDFFALSSEDWMSGFALKFFGAVQLSKALWPALKQSRGSIVNIAGLGARMPAADFTIGGSVNSALLNFTKALSEIGLRDGVRVNAINPGFFMTDRMTHTLRLETERTGQSTDEAAQALLARLGATRFGKPEEVGSLVAFMVSSQAQYLNGTAIELDSGVRRDI